MLQHYTPGQIVGMMCLAFGFFWIGFTVCLLFVKPKK